MTTAAAPRTVTSTVTANTTATAGKHLPVDATSGAITVTLPAATASNAGGHLSIEKRDSSSNPVTISGSIRGATSTITLYWQNETIEFTADVAGSWVPVAGHKTKASLDGAYQSLLPADANTTTAVVNAWLAAGSPLGIKRLIGSLTTTAPLTIPSNTYLDATGATITLGSNVNNQMLRNAGSVTSTVGDTNITVVGGTWNRGANGGQANDNTLHSLQFYGVTGLKVRDLTVTSTSGKYAVHVYSCSQFEVGNLTFNTYSDGVHLNGSCSDGWVHDIHGITGDDFVAYTLADYTTYQAGAFGDSNGIVIERIYGNPAAGKGGTAVGNGVAIYGALNPTTNAVLTHRNIKIRDVHVTATGNAVHFNSGANAASGAYGDVTIDGVSNAGSGHGVLIGTGTFADIVARRLQQPQNDSSHYAVQITGSNQINELTVADSTFNGLAGSTPINLLNGAVLITLRVSRVTVNNATASAQTVNAQTGSTLTRAIFDGLVALKVAWALGSYAGTTAIYATNISTVPGSVSGWFAAGATAVLDVRFAASFNAGPNGFGKTTGAQITSRDFGLYCDVSTLQYIANSMAYNTNASLGCGVGPVVCNGTTWKHLYTGATA